MQKIIVYQADPDGYFVGQTWADESPEEAGVFLIPGNAYKDAPPGAPATGTLWRRAASGDSWVMEPIPSEPEPETVPVVPRLCTPAQGLVALFALKQITEDDVLAAIARIPDDVQRYTARIGYQRTTTWERYSPTMQAMAQLLQLSETDLDELFAYAVNVQV